MQYEKICKLPSQINIRYLKDLDHLWIINRRHNCYNNVPTIHRTYAWQIFVAKRKYYFCHTAV